MIPIQVRFRKNMLVWIDSLVNKGIYSNRSDAIRSLVDYHFIEAHLKGVFNEDN